MEQVTKLLQKTMVRQVMDKKKESKTGPRHFVWLKDSDTVGDALEAFAKYRILSIPIRDPESRAWGGFVDVMDVLCCALKRATLEEGDEAVQWAKYKRDIDFMTSQDASFRKTPLATLLKSTKFCPVSVHANVFQVVEDVFARGIHRVPVVDDDDSVLGIISQSDVLALLSRCMLDLGPAADRAVEALHLATKEAIQMSNKAPVIESFFLMLYHKIGAVAVVDERGVLCASLSAADLRGLTQATLAALLLPPAEFYEATNMRTTLLTCTKTTSFGTLLQRMTESQQHRTWVVDEEQRPIGVVTLSDICAVAAALPKPGFTVVGVDLAAQQA